MLHKRASFGNRKVSPPQPTCMTDEQKATYLANLRNNRPARPGGARPLPGKPTAVEFENGQHFARSESVLSFRQEDGNGSNRNPIANSSSLPAMGTLKGRPLVQSPFVRRGNGSSVVQQSEKIKYQELTSREREKQEAHSLREALEKIDHVDDKTRTQAAAPNEVDDETRIYTAAQKEAADLVWKHINPQLATQEKTAAYRNPDFMKNRKLQNDMSAGRRHSRTDSHDFVAATQKDPDECKIEGLKVTKRDSQTHPNSQQTSMHSNRRRSSGKRNFSSGSHKGVFRNPGDQIYEEPEELATPPRRESVQELPLQARPRNALLKGSRPLPEKSHSVPLPESLKFDRFEIHRNPPTQSRNADYTANFQTSREATPEVETPKGRAMEIRSDEIRAATSMKRKDRSPKLPTPTAVSDRPGRPIVSFDPSWRPGGSPRASVDIDASPTKSMPALATVNSAPVVPTINLPDDVPSINLPEEESVPSICVSAPAIPTINLPDEPQDQAPIPSINVADTSTRSLPEITVSDSKPKPRPLPFHTQSSPAKLPPTGPPRTRVPWLSRDPNVRGSTVTCNSCQLPIAGRIVTASGSVEGGPKARFHPECFTCFHCSTKLECVSFYPESTAAREERFEQDPNADPSEMRFFCHLDYHDLFSPRCASCKTPIEGAVILAAGKSWHEGHFFCAECGDPFSSTSPFVEDKGYAYCVGCHTRRTSARCRGCKKQILDEVSVEALGGKWHDECFRCDECGVDFGDDGRFFVREVEVELTEKEKRKGVLTKKFEERAVCHRCETLRLRRVDAFL